MKNFIRDNPTIAFGLGLPVILVLLFLAISGIPTLLVAPAQYDVVYATNYNYYNNAQNAFQIAVVGDRVQVSYIGNTQPYQQPRLWRFNPKTGAVKEIAIMLPPGLAPNTGRPPEPGEQPAVTPRPATTPARAPLRSEWLTMHNTSGPGVRLSSQPATTNNRSCGRSGMARDQ